MASSEHYSFPGMVPVTVEGSADLIVALRGFGHELQVSLIDGRSRFELLKLDPSDPYYAEPVAWSDDWQEILSELRWRVQ